MSDFIGQSVVVMVTIQNIKNQYERAICHSLAKDAPRYQVLICEFAFVFSLEIQKWLVSFLFTLCFQAFNNIFIIIIALFTA